MLKKTILTLAIASISISNVYAWKIVYDPSAAANAAKQLIEAKNQIIQLKAQVQEAKNLYNSVNGTRGIVNLLDNPAIVSRLPKNYQDIYMGIKNAKSGKWEELYQLTLDGKASKNATTQNLREAYDNSLKAHSEKIQESYNDTYRRLENLNKFSSQISTTKDPKEIADLQARIAAEQVGISTDKMRLELLKEIKIMREQALKQQASNKWHESLKKPFVMPDIHVDIKKPFSN